MANSISHFLRTVALVVSLIFGTTPFLAAQVSGAISFSFSFGNETVLQLPLPKVQVDIYLDNNWFVGASGGLGVSFDNGGGSWWNAGLVGGYKNGIFLVENSVTYFTRDVGNGQMNRISANPKLGLVFLPLIAKAGPSFNLASWNTDESRETELRDSGTLPGSDLQLPNFELGYRLESQK